MKNKDIDYNIRDITGHTLTFTKLNSLKSFLVNERKFWKEKSEKLEAQNQISNHFHIHRTFDNILKIISSWPDESKNWDQSGLNSKISEAFRPHNHTINTQWLWSGHAFINRFVEICSINGNQCAEAFLAFVYKDSIGNLSDINTFQGVIYGYEYKNQDSTILQRRVNEKRSLTYLRNQLSNAQDDLFRELEEQQQSIGEWSKNQKELGSTQLSDQKSALEQQIDNQNGEFVRKLKGWSNTISELEKTYEEKLRIQKPAEYWKKAASRYSNQGTTWVIILTVTVIAGLINAQDFFVHWLKGNHTELALQSFQGIILFGSIAAIYAYILRVLSRLAFSSFHLMRDAQEREQLTYLYLALTHESAVDERSREIVLQALFSRSETGLLSQEHGPTMPMGDIVKTLGNKS